MPANLKNLNKSEKMRMAEKHLQKYVAELKRHFDFSDFQLIKLLEKTSVNIKNIKKDNLKLFLLKLIKNNNS